MCDYERSGEFESQCKGLCLFDDKKFIVIDNDSCYNGGFKVIHRKQRTFADGSSLNYDEVLMCADKEVLCGLADAIKRKFE